MPSGLPLKEIKTLLNKPGEELDERFRALGANETASGGYIVELDGNLEKDADGELKFTGAVETTTFIPDTVTPLDGSASSSYKKTWERKGKGDVYMSFWFRREIV